MNAAPELYKKKCKLSKDNKYTIVASQMELKCRCVGEPLLPLECQGDGWQFHRTFLPLNDAETHDVYIFHDVEDRWVKLTTVTPPGAFPLAATHIVKFLPIRLVWQKIQFLNGNAIDVPVLSRIEQPIFMFAELREKGQTNEHLAILS